MSVSFLEKITVRLACIFVMLWLSTPLLAEIVKISRISHPPKLEEFDTMAPSEAAKELQTVTGFIQLAPADGKPGTQRTEAFLGYDDSNLYIVLTCWDDPAAIRSSLSRREPSTPFDTDDYIEITLDTFHDKRHAFVFDVNPVGVQADALYTEGQGTDYSWDTVWYSRGKITPQGYVVWVAIPFRSLRFPVGRPDGWGITLSRYIARKAETDYWPRVSSAIAGRLNQAASMNGLEGVSPGRSMQFIPYAESRTFLGLNQQDPLQPFYSQARFQGKVGLDSKFVFHNSLVLDATVNPDFAQVESDDPQNTVNQRFQVYFPEKRPFFLENSNFFEAPLIAANLQPRLVFTRDIADPKYGVRLTGKQGPWNLGVLMANDCSPGETVVSTDPASGKCAKFSIARVSHDLGTQSGIGVMYTDRELNGNFNRAGGLDATVRLGKNWNSTYRGYMSSTSDLDGYRFGQLHEGVLFGNGRRFTFSLQYLDITPNFVALSGYVPRVDQRAFNQYGHFYWRPAGKFLVLHGPEENVTQMWDHRGATLQQAVSFDYAVQILGNIVIAPIVAYESDTLRPVDFAGYSNLSGTVTFPGLPNNRQYVQDAVGLVFRGSPNRFFSWNTNLVRDGAVVVVPTPGQLPYTGDETALTQKVSFKPIGRLQLDTTYILDRVRNGKTNHAVFNNHIIRAKANYQFTREFSLRFIGQYNGLIANPQYSSLQTTKNMNFDVLFTYLLHPGTAIYAGYNSNLENVEPALCTHLVGSNQCDPNGNGLLRTRNSFVNDGRQLFVKISYLFRR